MNVATRNYVTVKGQGSPVLMFANGSGCDQNVWRHIAPRYEAGARTVLFDYVGAGRSDLGAYDPARYSVLEGYAEDVIEICDGLDLPPVVFVGHSVGGIIGVLAANRRPDLFESLVLVCPSPRFSNAENYVGGFSERDVLELLDLMDINHMDWAANVAPMIMANPDRPELSAELEGNFCRTDPEIAKEFARATFLSDHRSALAGVRAPTLIVECEEDALAPPEVGRYMEAHIQGSRKVTLDASGHCPHLSAPDRLAAALDAFLQDRASGVPGWLSAA
jgi:sigma-B regulation protein RsbQ